MKKIVCSILAALIAMSAFCFSVGAETSPCAHIKDTDVRIADGGRLTVFPGEEVLLSFEIESEEFLIPGWTAEPLRENGFTVPEDPVFIDGVTYMQITASDVEADTAVSFTYIFVRYSDIFGDGAVGWDSAERIAECSLEVYVEEPAPYAVLYGTEEEYYDGDVLEIPVGGEAYVWFSCDSGSTTPLTVGWLPSSLGDSGFTVSDDPVMFGETACFHIEAASLPVGSEGTLDYFCVRLFDIIGENAVGWIDAEKFAFTKLKVKVVPVKGDADGDGALTTDDAIYCLYHVFYPDDYPVSCDCDFDGDGSVAAADATYLLFHFFFPNLYALKN